MKVVQAIVCIFLILLIKPVSIKKKPTIITGNDETSIFVNNDLFSKKFILIDHFRMNILLALLPKYVNNCLSFLRVVIEPK